MSHIVLGFFRHAYCEWLAIGGLKALWIQFKLGARTATTFDKATTIHARTPKSKAY